MSKRSLKLHKVFMNPLKHNKIMLKLRPQNIYWQDWKYTLFVASKTFDVAMNINTDFMADVGENIGLKLQFLTSFSIRLTLLLSSWMDNHFCSKISLCHNWISCMISIWIYFERFSWINSFYSLRETIRLNGLNFELEFQFFVFDDVRNRFPPIALWYWMFWL